MISAATRGASGFVYYLHAVTRDFRRFLEPARTLPSAPPPPRLRQVIDALQRFDRRRVAALIAEELREGPPSGDHWGNVEAVANRIGEINFGLEAARRYALTEPRMLDRALHYCNALAARGRIDASLREADLLPAAVQQHPALLYLRGSVAARNWVTSRRPRSWRGGRLPRRRRWGATGRHWRWRTSSRPATGPRAHGSFGAGDAARAGGLAGAILVCARQGAPRLRRLRACIRGVERRRCEGHGCLSKRRQWSASRTT